MKAKDIRAMAPEALVKELDEMQREQFNLRMQNATGQLADNSKLRKLRRDIARMHTVMTQKTGNSV